jgi:hypothetical protein
MILVNFTQLFSRATFFQTVSLSTVNFTSQEQTNFSNLQNASKTLAVWPLQINPMENYVQGSNLTIQLPNETTTTFTSYYVNSKPNGDYYWAGYSSNGSHFHVAKFQTGAPTVVLH